MQTVAEMPEFSRNAASLLSGSEIQSLISHLAEHPCAGVLIAVTGGVRKLRWARAGMGKSGGVRVRAMGATHVTVTPKTQTDASSPTQKINTQNKTFQFPIFETDLPRVRVICLMPGHGF